VEPVEHRRRRDAGIGEKAPEPGTTVGKGRQRRVPGSSDSVEIAADQLGDGSAGFGDGAEDLAATGRRFNIADPNLQMSLAVSQLRMKVESRVTTIVGVAVSGWVTAQFRSVSPTFRVWRRKVSKCFPAPTGNICSNTSAAVL